MAEIVAAATTAGDIIAKAITPTGPVGVFVGATITAVDTLARLLLTGCDGAVASQNWVITAAQLAASGELGWNDNQNYPGSQSPLACGAPSSYDVSYTITAKPPVTVPALGGTSAQGAAQLASDLGLSIQIAQEVARDGIDVPTIESTQPGPGTVVPVGTVLDAVLALPGQQEGGGGVGGGGAAGATAVARGDRKDVPLGTGHRPTHPRTLRTAPQTVPGGRHQGRLGGRDTGWAAAE